MAEFLIVEMREESQPVIVEVIADRKASDEQKDVLAAATKLEPNRVYRAVRFDDADLLRTTPGIEAVDPDE